MQDFCSHLGLQPGQCVLDVGCGTGDSAAYMARHFSVHVHGADISACMINTAMERQEQLETEVKKRVKIKENQSIGEQNNKGFGI